MVLASGNSSDASVLTLLRLPHSLDVAGGLDLPMYEGETVHFKDVLLAMAREMVKEVRSVAPWLALRRARHSRV